MKLLPTLLCLTLVLRGCVAARAAEPPLSRYEYTEYSMGVDVRIVVYAPSRQLAERGCAAAFERFAQLDDVMSDYRNTSELMRLCARAGGPPVRISGDLAVVLRQSQRLAEQSDGAFDVTCSPLVRLWRKARKTHTLPDPVAIASARRLVGWQKLRVDTRRQTAELAMPGMQLDLGGIGKGYADDCAQRVLRHYGITRALVEAGGDIVVSGAPPGEAGWSIEVPAAGAPAPVMRLANCAISTSGDTEQFEDIGGRRYSHILDPRTGQALTSRIAVTIIARDGLTSDGLSTAVSVLGPQRGDALVRRYLDAWAYIRTLPETPQPRQTCLPGNGSAAKIGSAQPFNRTNRGIHAARCRGIVLRPGRSTNSSSPSCAPARAPKPACSWSRPLVLAPICLPGD